MRHVEPTGPVFNTTGFYTQFSRRFGPIGHISATSTSTLANDDPVYHYASPNDYAPHMSTDLWEESTDPSAGIRYDFTEHSALKLQYDRISERGLPSVNGLTSQIAFTF